MIIYVFCNQEKNPINITRREPRACSVSSAWEGKTSGRAALGSSEARPWPHPGLQKSHLRWQPRWLDSSLRQPGLSKDLSATWRSISHLLSLASPSPTINSVSVSPMGLHFLVPATTTDAAQMASQFSNGSLRGRGHYGLVDAPNKLLGPIDPHHYLTLFATTPFHPPCSRNNT